MTYCRLTKGETFFYKIVKWKTITDQIKKEQQDLPTEIETMKAFSESKGRTA